MPNTVDIANLTAWVLTDGKAGTENPCIALAQAVGVEPQLIRIRVLPLWR